MAKAAGKAKQSPKQPQAPPRKATPSRSSRLLPAIGVVGLVALVGLGIVLLRDDPAAGPTGAVAAPLPNTSDYHSLLVAPNAPGQLLLGTHQGLFRSTDAGRTWIQAELVDQDAMNLARSSSTTVWAAGHDVFARSEDGGSTWQNLQPAGLPSLDLHGFATDTESGRLWAAVAGEGLYRSDNGGAGFRLVTKEVGAGVMGLEVLPGGRILAADMQQQVLLSSEDDGKTWSTPLDRPVMAIAASPDDPRLLLAATFGSDGGIVRSSDAGQTWKPVLSLLDGAGPIGWFESEPATVYVVRLDRTLFRSTDAGATWKQVTKEAS